MDEKPKQLRYRSYARAIAIIDLVMVSLYMCTLFVLAYCFGLWMVLVVGPFVVIVKLMAALKLVNATEIGQEVSRAAKLSRIWHNCTAVYTVLLALAGLIPIEVVSAIFHWVMVMLYCVGIYVVHQFIMELDAVVGTGILPSHLGPEIMELDVAKDPGHGQVSGNISPMAPTYDQVLFLDAHGNSPPTYDEAVEGVEKL